jgi:DedD protein
MAFFKFRKGGDEQPPPPPAAESVEVMRKRARHRLIGAAVLVLAGVVGFPLLFDNHPRPIAVDIPIDIPDKAKVKPLGPLPAPAPVPLPQSGGIIDEGPAPAPKVAASEPTKQVAKAVEVVKPEVKTEVKAEVKAETKAAPKLEPKVEAKPAEKVLEKVVAPVKPDDGAKAKALLDGMPADKVPDAGAGRFVVQVGAFSDVLKAREARVKLEKAGMKTYTQVVTPKEGKRIRVRVGPFENKAEADKVAEKIKKLDLPASVLEL